MLSDLNLEKVEVLVCCEDCGNITEQILTKEDLASGILVYESDAGHWIAPGPCSICAEELPAIECGQDELALMDDILDYYSEND